MSGKNYRRSKKRQEVRKGRLCRVKGSDRKGIFMGMDGTLAVLKTNSTDMRVPFKNLERVFDEN